MLNSELLQLHPQHLEELRSFHEGFSFKEVEIAVRHVFPSDKTPFENPPLFFHVVAKKLHFDEVFWGGDRTHAIFSTGEDNIFYCYSFAQLSEHAVECIIFKLII